MSKIFNFFHAVSKDVYKPIKDFKLDRESWPKNWISKEFKEYKSSKKVLLKPGNSENPKIYNLFEIIKKRYSGNFDEKLKGENLLNLEIFSEIILNSIALKNFNNKAGNRLYPSAGARYSLEFYFIIKKVEGIDSGVYHFNVLENSLELITLNPTNSWPKISNYYFVENASVLLFMTSIFDRSISKYNDRGYRYILQESGHAMQNIYLACTAHSVRVRAIGGTFDTVVEKILKVDSGVEELIYSAIIA